MKQTRISAARTFSGPDSTLSTQIPVASLSMPTCPLVVPGVAEFMTAKRDAYGQSKTEM